MEKYERLEVFKNLSANDEQAEELYVYSRSELTEQYTPDVLDDEAFVKTWKAYSEEAATDGVFDTLKKYLPQLNFPIEEGISKTDEYKNATLRGLPYCKDRGLVLVSPESLTLEIYKSAAGSIPVLFTECRDDFVAMVRAMVCRSEPRNIPDSMGACMVKGFNNWDRITRYRSEWESSDASGEWSFALIKERKELYQDRFIILSDNGYSGVSAGEIGLSEQEWKRLSVIIRREHECTHYLTQRVFGSARNNMFDELVADYAGIVRATGDFKAEWFFKFAGLENYPKYRQGARLENYKGTPPLSDGAFTILQKLVYQSAMNLQSANIPADAHGLTGLYKLSLEELAVL